MRRLTEEAVRAGAFGFTTSRTNAHKTTRGEMVPGRFAEIDELTGIGAGLGAAQAGTFGMNSDFEDEEPEFAWLTRLAKVDRPADRPAALAAHHGRRAPGPRGRRFADGAGCGPPGGSHSRDRDLAQPVRGPRKVQGAGELATVRAPRPPA